MSDIDLDALEAAIRDGSSWLGNPGVLDLIARVRNAEAAIQAVRDLAEATDVKGLNIPTNPTTSPVVTGVISGYQQAMVRVRRAAGVVVDGEPS